MVRHATVSLEYARDPSSVDTECVAYATLPGSLEIASSQAEVHMPSDNSQDPAPARAGVRDGYLKIGVTPITSIGTEIATPKIGGLGAEAAGSVVREKKQRFRLGAVDELDESFG